MEGHVFTKDFREYLTRNRRLLKSTKEYVVVNWGKGNQVVVYVGAEALCKIFARTLYLFLFLDFHRFTQNILADYCSP